MVPSRGLRPAHIASFNSRRSLCLRNPSSRQFSSIPRASTPSGARLLAHPLRPAVWRTGASASRNATGTTIAIRHGSWYAPWTWGGSSKPAGDASPIATPSEFAADTSGGLVSERVVTTATPELAPAGIDKAAVFDGAGATQSATQSGHSTVEALVDDILQNPQGPVSEYMGDPTTAIDRIGALKSMGLDFGWGPTATFEWLIEHVYIMTPYGWGASIIASTVILRTCLFYFQMQGSDNMAKMAALNPITKDYTDHMREASNAGDQEKMQFYKSRLSAVYKEAGVRPIVGMLPMFWQMIFGFGAWRCIRNMSWLPVPGMDQGGWLWFQNLAVADPYYLVPAIGAGLVYVTVRLGGDTGASNQTVGTGMQKFMRIGMPTVMFAVMSQQPAGVALYVLSSSTISTMTAALLRNPSFRSMTNMSPLPSKESQVVWTKVARGEVKLHDVIDAKGNIIYKPQPTYQSPTRTAPKTIEVKAKANKQQQRGLNIKSQSPSPSPPHHPTGLNIKSSTAALPSHLVSPSSLTEIDPAQRDRDDDFTAGPSPGIRNQVDWVVRNYSPTYVYRRVRNWIWENPEIQMKIRKREREMEIKRRKEEESRRGGRR